VQSAIETIARAEGLMQAQPLTRMAEIALAAINDSERPPRTLRGEERFRRRDGRDLSRRISPAELADLDTPVEHEHPDIHPAAATTRWDGRRIDRDFAIAVLADSRRRARERAQLAG
jgi:hypothetical protein